MTLEVSKVTKIRKRNGQILDFDQAKIVEAIWRAAQSVGGKDRGLALQLSSQVVELANKQFSSDKVPTVEDIQDLVERVLMEQGHSKTAKAYILYRQKRAEIREEKKRILEKDDTDSVDKRFDLNALRVLKARYLRKDGARLIETPKQLFMRVATHIVLTDIIFDGTIYSAEGGQPPNRHEEFNSADYDGKLSVGNYPLNRYHLEALKRLYDRMNEKGFMKVTWSRLLAALKNGELAKYETALDTYYNLMVSKRFMPNTPALANFGNPLGMGSACFVMKIEDSIESIMETLKKTSIVFKAGGGMGYNFSDLRPEGDIVSSTSGIASGPISFMRLFDMMTEVIKQGGIRRGANMGILNINHPDIEKFITSKKGNAALRNFNLSVLVTPDFWDAYAKNEPYPLVNPRNGDVVREVNPRMLFDMIVYHAWESAEPGLIFFDQVNKYNPFFESLGPIVCTNPCGEVLLYPNESCNLGSINVWAFCKINDRGERYFDWDGLKETVYSSVKFLDNIIDINNFPLKEIEEMTLSTRKVGLGIMGLGDLLYDMGTPYNSEEGRRFMELLMEFVNYHSKIASIERAKERGSFPLFDKSFYTRGRLPISGADEKDSCHFDWVEIRRNIQKFGLRNSYTTVVAPTGSISMIAGCSSGIEPVYSLVYEKNVKVGSFYYVDPVFEQVMLSEGLYDSDLISEVSDNSGSIQRIMYIPSDLKRVFVTALDISPDDHIRALAALQRWVDSSISKTNNFPADATVEYMRESYLLAYKLGCKDITVFRDTSIKDQVLVAKKRTDTRESQSHAAVTQIKHEIPVHHHAQEGYLHQPVEAHIPKPASTLNTTYYTPAGHDYGHNDGNHGVGDTCPVCDAQVFFVEGCVTCPDCGWGLCS
ncbi:MAG: adenosylcobalamin-dependent ribonucleoside-diphosphate reductase [Thaumarchaeota archaeon]|nr:adenosylcobalamin-dependent ribonucleoside-diphosphate reductase [Nitrososphaerota archaeon]